MASADVPNRIALRTSCPRRMNRAAPRRRARAACDSFPWRVAFRDDRALPTAVRGPVECSHGRRVMIASRNRSRASSDNGDRVARLLPTAPAFADGPMLHLVRSQHSHSRTLRHCSNTSCTASSARTDTSGSPHLASRISNRNSRHSVQSPICPGVPVSADFIPKVCTTHYRIRARDRECDPV
jgi:hypothetical protein